MRRTGNYPSRFRREFRRAIRRGKDMSKLARVMDALEAGEKLSDRYNDHLLVGKYAGCRECHLEPDWLLVYQFEEDHEGNPVVSYLRLGSHSDLNF